MKVDETIVSYNENVDRIVIKESVKVDSINVGSLASLYFEVNDEIVSITLKGVTYQINRLYQISDLLLKVRSNDTVTFTVNRNSVITDLEIKFLEQNFIIVD